MSKHTPSARLDKIERDLDEIKKTMAKVKTYSLWILFGLVVPITQALGLPDLSDLFGK